MVKIELGNMDTIIIFDADNHINFLIIEKTHNGFEVKINKKHKHAVEVTEYTED